MQRFRNVSVLARRLPGAAALALLLGLAACAQDGVSPARASAAANVDEPAWVELGPMPIARAVVAGGAACPVLAVDGETRPMRLRAGHATPAQRPGADKPAAFPVDVCEAVLAPGAHTLRLGDRSLAPVRSAARRIVVLGDTGCRIKGTFAQPCSDPDGWPFAQVAASAAALAPDLVIHVGDYHYRESPCPATQPGCAGSPWGYGWDAWNADFLVPARPLLAAAPWVFVRGNHEECERAGQGWFRLLAPEPWTPRRSCDRPEDDADADFSAPYAVPLDATTQLVVFDSAHAGNLPLDLAKPGDALIHRRYVGNVQALDALASPGLRTWFASHHPVLAFAPDDRPGAMHPHPGNPALQQALDELNGPVYFPPGVQAALHGHVHLFQALGFDDGHPATLVAGNGGDDLDIALPDPLPAGSMPAPGVRVAQATYSNRFGFLLLERADEDGRWTMTAYTRAARVMTRCTLAPAGALACAPPGWLH